MGHASLGANAQVRRSPRLPGAEPEPEDGHRDRVRLPIAHDRRRARALPAPNGDWGGECVTFTTTSPDPDPPWHLTFSATSIVEPARM